MKRVPYPKNVSYEYEGKQPITICTHFDTRYLLTPPRGLQICSLRLRLHYIYSVSYHNIYIYISTRQTILLPQVMICKSVDKGLTQHHGSV